MSLGKVRRPVEEHVQPGGEAEALLRELEIDLRTRVAEKLTNQHPTHDIPRKHSPPG